VIKLDVKKFYNGEMAFLIGLKTMVELAIQQLNESPCIIDNSHQWEQIHGFVQEHLRYLYENRLCSQELKEYFEGVL
jgi:hypothetical protein